MDVSSDGIWLDGAVIGGHNLAALVEEDLAEVPVSFDSVRFKPFVQSMLTISDALVALVFEHSVWDSSTTTSANACQSPVKCWWCVRTKHKSELVTRESQDLNVSSWELIADISELRHVCIGKRWVLIGDVHDKDGFSSSAEIVQRLGSSSDCSCLV